MIGDAAKKTPASALNASAMMPARVSFLNVIVRLLSGAGSKRRGVGFADADADGLIEADDEDLAVADLPRLGGGGDRLDDLVGLVAGNRDLDLEFRQEAHGVFGAAVDFRVALLASVAFDLGDGHPVHANRSQSVADLVELEWLDDGHDDFHGFNPRLGPVPAGAGAGQLSCPCRAQPSLRSGNAP